MGGYCSPGHGGTLVTAGGYPSPVWIWTWDGVPPQDNRSSTCYTAGVPLSCRVPPERTWDQRLGYPPGKEPGTRQLGKNMVTWGYPTSGCELTNKLKILPSPSPLDAGGNEPSVPQKVLHFDQIFMLRCADISQESYQYRLGVS